MRKAKVQGRKPEVPAQLAEALGFPHVTHARKIVWKDRGKLALVERGIEGGYLLVEIASPAVIAVVKKINRYRLPTIFGILDAGKKEIIELGCAECLRLGGLNIEETGAGGSPTRVAGVFQSRSKRRVEMIAGSPEGAARELLRRLRQRGAL